MSTRLDFSLCPDLSSRWLFYALPEALEKSLERGLPETLARLEGALTFGYFVSFAEIKPADEPKATRQREACLRAALVEFASSDEALGRDLAATGRAPLRIHDCPEPHVRAIRELRNLEVHLRASPLSSEKKDVLTRVGGEESETQTEIWTIDALTEAEFSQLRNAKYYTQAEIRQLVAWFNQAQDAWGVDHVLYLAIRTYAEKLESRYLAAAGTP